MQSSSPPASNSQHAVSQHSSPHRATPSSPAGTQSPTQHQPPQQHIPTASRDTTPVASSKPSTPPAQPYSQPHTPQDPSSRPASTATTAVTSGSTLSATAPHFRTRLIDAPIDLAGLGQPTDGTLPRLKKATMESGGYNVLDCSTNFSAYTDGRTPTQESFPPIHTPSLSSPSPTLSSTTFSPDFSSQFSGGGVGDSSQSDFDSTLRTPNVYVNGLPPNFPEERLLAMTSPFGEVISVRTFTRHVSEKPSGYGFVLFGSVDAAAKCIESLRKYRNLHPSFSKQIHKIPGTVYANSVALPPSATEPPDSFKSRMDRLKDTGSTNLYIEGLPLDIESQTLQALVSPYRIMSSRLFQTRLSNPPRIIAFVRLESRQAAEEVVERLHGRMVRGLGDAGSRISVRFADTAEQRELRRNERQNREGENSPARLTMAQAALLNLQGTQLAPSGHMSRIPSPNFGSPPLMPNNLGLLQRGLPPPIGYHNQQALDEYPGLRNVHAHSNDGLNSQAADYVSSGLRMPSHAIGADESLSREMLQMGMTVGGGFAGAGAIQAQDGYTEMELLLLQMHEQKQREMEKLAALQQQVLASEFDVSPSGLRADASLGGLQANAIRESGRRLMGVLPTMNEQDFHATARGQRSVMSPDVSTGGGLSSSQHDQSSQLSMDLDSRLTFTRQRNQTHAEARAQAQADAQAQTHHIRSTTVPSQYFNLDRRHNTQTFSDAHNTNPLTHLTMNSGRLSLHDSDTTIRDMTQLRAAHLNSSLMRDPNDTVLGRNTLRNQTSLHSVHDGAAFIPTKVRANSISHGQLQTRIDTSVPSRKIATPMDDDDGSGLDSPALSYTASVRTPASLSPATPFSAFGETFEGPTPIATGCEVGLGMGVGGGAAGKQKIRVNEAAMGLGSV